LHLGLLGLGLRIGIVGSSSGNGHPFSWAALINGYAPNRLATVPFARIREYLRPEVCRFDTTARVTHVWSSRVGEAEAIADFAKVENPCNNLEELIDGVDAIIHARDDYPNTPYFARLYRQSMKPVLFDKPLAMSKDAFSEYTIHDPRFQRTLTGSALRFDPIFRELRRRGPQTRLIKAWSAGPWEVYGLHLIEPILEVVGYQRALNTANTLLSRSRKVVTFNLSGGPTLRLEMALEGTSEFRFDFDGLKVSLLDPTKAFVGFLRAFFALARGQSDPEEPDRTAKALELLWKGA